MLLLLKFLTLLSTDNTIKLDFLGCYEVHDFDIQCYNIKNDYIDNQLLTNSILQLADSGTLICHLLKGSKAPKFKPP